MQEFAQTKNFVEKEFSLQIKATGPQVIKAYCVNGRGELWTSNSMALSV